MITDFIKYALHNAKVEICKFLIDKGADVDSMEPTLLKHFVDDQNFFV